MFVLMKTRVLRVPMAFSNAWAGILDGCVIGPYLFLPNPTGDVYLNSPSIHTVWAFGKCATACASKHVVSSPWRATSFYSSGSRSSGSKIWAKEDRSWWSDCLACTFTRYDSSRLLPVEPHEELNLQDPCGF